MCTSMYLKNKSKTRRRTMESKTIETNTMEAKVMDPQAKEIIETAIIQQSTEVPEIMQHETGALQDALNELDITDRKSIIYLVLLLKKN